MVGFLVDDFCCRLPLDGIVETILNHGIEFPCGIGIPVIVYATLCIDVRNLLPNTAFTGTNGAYPFQQFTEIVFPEYGGTLFQTVIVQNKSFLNIFIQDFGSPLAKLGSLDRIDTVAYGNNGIEIVEIGRTFHCSCSFFLNYFHFGNSCFFAQLALFVNVVQMFADGRDTYIKQGCHCLLSEPNGFILDDGLHLSLIIRQVIKYELYFFHRNPPSSFSSSIKASGRNFGLRFGNTC